MFYLALQQGYGESEARNLLLLLFVLFENFQTFASRSERKSAFALGVFGNPLLLFSILAAQALHIAAMRVVAQPAPPQSRKPEALYYTAW